MGSTYSNGDIFIIQHDTQHNWFVFSCYGDTNGAVDPVFFLQQVTLLSTK